MRHVAIFAVLLATAIGSGCGVASKPDFAVTVPRPIEQVYADFERLNPAVEPHINVPNPLIAVRGIATDELRFSFSSADGRSSEIVFTFAVDPATSHTLVSGFVTVPPISAAHIHAGTTVSEARVESKLRGWLIAYAAVSKSGSNTEGQLDGMRLVMDALSVVTNPGMKVNGSFGDGRMLINPQIGPPARGDT